MPAKRYSGDVTINLIWNDAEERYAAKVAAPGYRSEFVLVGAPAVLEHAVDSPEAYDSAARAAIAFADEEPSGSGIGELAALDESGYHVGRSHEKRWPSSPQ